MRTYTVTGLADEGEGVLYVAAVLPGRHEPADASQRTRTYGYDLYRYVGYFEADSAGEAEQIAVDVVSHYRDEDAGQWNPRGRYRTVETIDPGDQL